MKATTTTTINVTTKKGTAQLTTWEVWQNHPWPDIEKGGRFQWRNADGLFGTYTSPARGIGRNYTAVLLRSDLAERQHNRKDYAGYRDGQNDKENPGCIVYRGKSLGELSITIDGNGYATIRTRYGEYPDTTTPGEREFIKREIVPYLLAFIEANRAELKAQAIAGIRQQVADRITEAKDAIDRLSREAEAAIKAEEGRKA